MVVTYVHSVGYARWRRESGRSYSGYSVQKYNCDPCFFFSVILEHLQKYLRAIEASKKATEELNAHRQILKSPQNTKMKQEMDENQRKLMEIESQLGRLVVKLAAKTIITDLRRLVAKLDANTMYSPHRRLVG